MLVKTAKYIGFCVYGRSYLMWSPQIADVDGSDRDLYILHDLARCFLGWMRTTLVLYYGGPLLIGPNIVSKNGQIYTR